MFFELFPFLFAGAILTVILTEIFGGRFRVRIVFRNMLIAIGILFGIFLLWELISWFNIVGICEKLYLEKPTYSGGTCKELGLWP